MAEADWTICTDSLSQPTIDRGVSAGFTPPSGGGSFVYGYHSLAATQGAVGSFVNLTNFAPMAKGCRITGALKRSPSGGPLNFAIFLFGGAQGASVNDNAYLLGLADGDPHHIVLRKGKLAEGLPDVAPGTNGVLRRSTATFANDTWLHLRLDIIVNLNGDVRLQVFRSDLNAHVVTSPVWVAEPGMTEFVDDALGINSGSQPYINGRAGHCWWSKDVTRRGLVDHLTLDRQL